MSIYSPVDFLPSMFARNVGHAFGEFRVHDDSFRGCLAHARAGRQVAVLAALLETLMNKGSQVCQPLAALLAVLAALDRDKSAK
ncbi:hypothetical protein D2917_15325 [Cupriavidus oxalaticus]|uniref:Uncharacterized protein n=1 Tax=Cupriavidus oxalaticus TaxID=96344 RepID=A0A5P3VH12_9BURK|nr:hypothetical protein D2917_15325 [Cupriavidus oxalaticus]